MKHANCYNVEIPTRPDDNTYAIIQRYYDEAKNTHASPQLESVDRFQQRKELSNPIIKFFRKKQYDKILKSKSLAEQNLKMQMIPGFSFKTAERSITYNTSYTEYTLNYISPDPRIEMPAPEYPVEKIPIIIDIPEDKVRIASDIYTSLYNIFIYNQVTHRLFNDFINCGIGEAEAIEMCKHYCQIVISVNIEGSLVSIDSRLTEQPIRKLKEER